MEADSNLWGRRLKSARVEAKWSQKRLGIEAGLDEFVASTRINRYELGVHQADFLITQKLAGILNVPTCYFYTEDEALAEIVVIFHRCSTEERLNLTKVVREALTVE